MKKLLPKSAMIARGLAAGLAIMSFAKTADANPFASSLTNNAGIVSFRINQTTTTNDLVQIISSGGTVTNVLQAPGNNIITRGLIVTNLGIAPGTFQVRIKHIGSGIIATNSPTLAFGAPRGIAANVNPASPYFGWIYAANSGSTTGGRGQGIFEFGGDLNDVTGQGNTAKTGGYTKFTAANAGSSPFGVSVASDDSVLVTDWTDSSGGLITLPPLLTSFSYTLKQLTGAAAAPVGSNNNHGSVVSAIIVGTGANTKLYTVDEDYQRDPATGIATEWNSLWQYNIGSSYTGVTSQPWSNAPDVKLMTPFINSFSGQNMKVQSGNGYLYVNQRRSNAGQYDVFIVDPSNPVDANSYSGIGGFFWDSQTESLAEGYSDDVLRDANMIAVSPDGRYLAAIIAAGNSLVTAPDGSSAATVANEIFVIPLTNGIPNLPARQIFKFGGAGNGRDLTFDAADNVIIASSGLGYIQALDIGESTDATTGSDGTFNVVRPATQTSVATTTPLAYEQGSVPGVFTITRTPDDLGNPLTVFYTITGSATATTDYTVGGGALITTTNCVIAAGQTSTNITITPVDDTIPELTETVILTIKGSGGYSLGFPSFAQVAIVDNESPQLSVLSLSTNIFQGNLNDYAAITLRRLGDTNVAVNLDANSFTFGGTAVSNVDYYLTNLPATIPAGVVDYTFRLISPGPNGATAVGSRSINLATVAGGGYTVTNGTATTTLTLKAVPPENILFSDNFETDTTGSNWNVFFASYLNGSTDYNLVFGYDYTSGSVGNLSPIPAAPHSTSGDTKGVYMTVNKNAGISAGLNLYLKNYTFGSNYALRFDMFLVQNSSSTTQSKVEDAIFGINHSGTRTNWFRNQVSGTSSPGAPTLSDGLWFDVGADGTGGGGANTDYGAWSGPTWTNGVGVIGPTNLINKLASTTRQIFKKPPFDAGPALGGSMANTVINPTPTWVQVEVSQLGNLITWKVNNTVIFSYPNTNLVAGSYTNGTIMLGYTDPWDDLGNSSATSGEAGVIYDNVRVVSILPPTIIGGPSNIVASAGTATNLSVVVSTTTGTTNYQWTRNGTNVTGATSSTLNFAALGTTNYGTYAVIVDDGAYTTTSASVTVLPGLPLIITDPANRVTPVNTVTNLSVVAQTFSGVTNYQWYFNNVLLSGTTTNPFTLTVRSTNYGSFKVVVSDGAGQSATSAVATVTPPLPSIITQPKSRAAVQGSSPTFSVVATTSSGVTNYQWQYYGTNLAGKTTATLTLAGVQPISFGGPYTVNVSDGTTTVTSAPPAFLTFAVPQTLTNSVSGSTLSMTFGTEFGPSYIVEYKTNLTDLAWTTLSTTAGSGNPATVTDSLTNAPTRFYRIRLQ
jgi:hypothetical protein